MQGKHWWLAGLAALTIVGGAGYGLTRYSHGKLNPGSDASASIAAPDANTQARLNSDLQGILSLYRMIIVLLADEASLKESDKQAATIVGQKMFHEGLERTQKLSADFANMIAAKDPARLTQINALLDFVETDSSLFDADRLAFHELLKNLKDSVSQDSSLPAIRLHKRISEDLDALDEIEHNYDKEISQIFNRFDTRAIVLKREKWDDYVAHLQKLFNREKILKDYGTIVPYPAELLPKQDNDKEIFGYGLPPKTVALTFDDGPHAQYTNEIVSILKQYSIPAAFFEVGRNLGTIDANGKAKLGSNAAISRKLLADGYAVGNHSFTHAQLSKETGAPLKAEIENTDILLRAVDPNRSPLFRFPYGARNKEGLQILSEEKLRSVMWNVDSLDWADPVPKSIADRVLRSVEKEGRGIILFHDIHARTIKALPLVIDQLITEGYSFAGWDGEDFTAKREAKVATSQTITTGYANSWALVIGINDYQKWPKLHYAVNDARSIQQALVSRLGFSSDRVILLQDGDATRNGILSVFHDRLAHDAVQKNDRIFVFFAGHGDTRKLSSGREIGYIIPSDADPKETATDAIPMTEIQNIAESLTAKHVFFVMDACYSGLGLTRGGSGGFLRENAKRVGRQMLTAGGSDQMVADGGPDGHSIFSWTVLQGLAGKADLNGDGLITATELAAYVAPAVSGVSLQTPAFGSLPGSEGGDFVFTLPEETEYLSEDSPQLSSAAIALNNKLDASGPTVTTTSPDKPVVVAPVKVIDLQGQEQMLKPAPAVVRSARQMAQKANDHGLQMYREKNYADAEAAFTEALKLRPDFALAANNLGFVYYKQDKFVEAARWFENTIKADPSRSIAYLNLGDAYAKAGEQVRAQKAYKTYLDLAPNGPSAAYARQQLGLKP